MKIIFYLLCLLFGVVSCKKDKALPFQEPVLCDSIPASFSVDVEPIITSTCAVSGCHNAATATNGVVLETYAQISAEANRFICNIKHQAGCEPMPFVGQKLSDSTIRSIQCWIQSGTPEN